MTRTLAVDALERMEASRCLAREAITPLLARREISAEDQSFLWELVHGVTRHRTTIDRILTTFSRVKLRKVHRRVLQALRIAVYQIVYLDRVPRWAAVYDSVEIVKARFPGWIVKFANGCLRAVSRAVDMKVAGPLPPEDLRRAVPISGQRHCLFTAPLFPDPREDPVGSLALRHSHPEWLVRRWLERYGPETAEAVLRAGNEPPFLWLRAAPDRIRDLVRELGRRGIGHEVTAVPPEAVRLTEPVGRIHELPGYRQGWFVVQDRTAMRAAPLLGPRPGDRVLDLCAAPGGKATHLAHLVGPEGTVVAVDRRPRRLAKLLETAGRLGLGNISPVVADARAPDLDLGEPFDRVLLDVPCSNTGVLAKRVEARHRISPEQVESLAEVQRELLRAAVRHSRPGAVLVYSTCSLEPEEGPGLLHRAIEDGLPLELEEEISVLPEARYCDGGYLARLVRKR